VHVEAVAELCRRLDGLPLAIELAAARSSILPPAALLARMSGRLPLLRGGSRDTPHRLQTMHNAIAWSYDLLTAEEQRLMRSLPVFAGGFSLEAVEAIVRLSGLHQPTASLAVLETIQSLVEKSLLVTAPVQSGEARFSMLETIREFTLEMLNDAGEAEPVHRAHARYFQELAGRASAHLPGPAQNSWLAQLDADHNNLRAALSWALEAEPETALQLAGSLAFFYFLRGHLREGRDWIEKALAATDASAKSPARAHALHGAGLLAHLQADDDRSLERLAAARTLFAELDDRAGLTRTLITSGIVAGEMGDFAQAAAWLEEALPALRAGGDPVGLGTTLAHLGMAAHAMGKNEQARHYLEEALALQRGVGDAWGVSTSLGLLGLVSCMLGDWDRAMAAYQEGLAQKLGEGSAASIARFLGGLAVVATHRGQVDLAARLFGALDRATSEYGFAFSHLERQIQDEAKATARASLGNTAFGQSWEFGRSLTLLEAADLTTEPALAKLEGVHAETASEPSFRLTPRELEVLRLVAAGQSDREIGDTLFISHRTAMRHVANVFVKMGVNTRSAAVLLAHREGLIELSE
jgi:non-specific serine/threonine protein kinase